VLSNLLCGVNIFITRGCLSSVRVIMVRMHVSLVELLCQAAMGLISALGYILSCVRGLLYLRPVVLGGLGHRLPRPWGGQCLSIPESLRTCLTGGPYFTPGQERWNRQTGDKIMSARSYLTSRCKWDGQWTARMHPLYPQGCLSGISGFHCK
jgi:hypothetical protein